MLWKLSRFIPQCVKNIFYHLPLAIVAVVYFGFPAYQKTRGVAGKPGTRLKVIGITGTNGKTTTTQLVTKILESAGKQVAMTSTINSRVKGVEQVNTSKCTTHSAWQVQKFLREARDADCEYVVIEVSSHALDQYRVLGVPFEIAVITNVTREHLDYHGTMAQYRQAKRRLFRQARMAVVNRDMERPEEYLSARPFERSLSYSIESEKADIRATHIESGLTGSTCMVRGVSLHIQLPGRFNIENALAAFATAELLEIDAKTTLQALESMTGVPGRMESVVNTQGISVLIDYAVTPDSLKKLYTFVTDYRMKGARIIAVFGACGERDRGKRPLMGNIVSSYADIVIVTNEDPYHEDPERILDEIESGITGKTKGENWFRIIDRRVAIAKALVLAKRGDIVIITGKGAESTIAIGDARLPWSERSVIEEELKKMANDNV